MDRSHKKNVLIFIEPQSQVPPLRMTIANALSRRGIKMKFNRYCIATSSACVYVASRTSVELTVHGRRFDAVFNCPNDIFNKYVISHMYEEQYRGYDPIKYLVELELGEGSYHG